jgi:hypothetical protein
MATTKPKKLKVGDEIELKGAHFVRLPDGTVTTASGSYTVTEAGVHVVDEAEYEVEK